MSSFPSRGPVHRRLTFSYNFGVQRPLLIFQNPSFEAQTYLERPPAGARVSASWLRGRRCCSCAPGYLSDRDGAIDRHWIVTRLVIENCPERSEGVAPRGPARPGPSSGHTSSLLPRGARDGHTCANPWSRSRDVPQREHLSLACFSHGQEARRFGPLPRRLPPQREHH